MLIIFRVMQHTVAGMDVEYAQQCLDASTNSMLIGIPSAADLQYIAHANFNLITTGVHCIRME